MVEKDGILKRVSDQVKGEAQRRQLNEYEAEYLVNESMSVVRDLFLAISEENIEKGSVKSVDTIKNWRHRNAKDIESDWRHMRFARTELINAAERYLDMPWIHCRELDWFIVNALIYAEIQATLDHFRANSMFLFSYVSKKSGNKIMIVLISFLKLIMFLVKWCIWLVILFNFLEKSLVYSVIFIGCTLFWQFIKWRERHKLNKIMSSMIRTYLNLNSISQSWLLIWDELKKSRDVGAVWDGVVYRLVEQRLNHSGQFQQN